MKIRLQKAGFIIGIVFILAFFGIYFWTQHMQRVVQKTVSALNSSDVVSLVVFDADWPRGKPELIVDSAKIDAILASLKTGKTYHPSHDQHNGFERFVILKPHNIAFSIYQKGAEGSSIIVKDRKSVV